MLALSDKPGTTTPAQRARIGALCARNGTTVAELKDSLGIDSIRAELSCRAASDLIERLGGGDLPNPPGRKPTRPRKQHRAPRSQSGAVGGNPVTRMISADNVDQIIRLGRDYFADRDDPDGALAAWLIKDFRAAPADGIRDIVRSLATSTRASHVILVLRAMIQRQNRDRKGAASIPPASTPSASPTTTEPAP